MYEELTRFRALLESNSAELLSANPPLATAAELIHQAFWAVLDHKTYLALGEAGRPIGAAHAMGWGAHEAWIMATIEVSGGSVNSSYANLRRTIEFTCYAAKVGSSDDRLTLWENRGQDPEARRAFARMFGVPTQYLSPRYRYLWQLLVAYDHTSSTGAHGNPEVLQRNYNPETSQWSYHANPDDVLPYTGFVVLFGMRLVEAYRAILTDCIVDEQRQTLDQMIRAARDALVNARLSRLGRRQTAHALVSIQEDSPTWAERELARILQRDGLSIPRELQEYLD